MAVFLTTASLANVGKAEQRSKELIPYSIDRGRRVAGILQSIEDDAVLLHASRIEPSRRR